MLATLASVAVPGASVAQMLVGQAETADGDTLVIDGVDVALFGIDAPELRQNCQREAEAWACGEESRRQLQAFIADRTVRCESRDSMADGTPLAVCTAGTLDLAGAMIEAGLAVALDAPASDYRADADRAMRARRGIWATVFQPPADWRAANPLPPSVATSSNNSATPRSIAGRAPAAATTAQTVTPGSCTIKGNRNYQGEWIYHLPGMPYYERTRPEEWFCTEAQAQAAGYRRAIVRR